MGHKIYPSYYQENYEKKLYLKESKINKQTGYTH